MKVKIIKCPTCSHAETGGTLDRGNIKSYNPNLAARDKAFQDWYRSYTMEGKAGQPYSDKGDYDYYSFFRNGGKDASSNGHFPDTYKRPNHETFSNESIYATPENPGGSWQGEKFIPHALNGLQVEGNQATPISDSMVMLGGDKHEDGGTDIQYGGKQIEAEKGEPVSIGNKGEAIVWGNMVLPGTSKKFKTIAKDLGERENKYDKLNSQATTLLQNNDRESKYERPGFNAGRIMQIGALYGQKDVNDKKEQLANLQKALLTTAHENNLDPQELSRGNFKKAKKGAFIPFKKQMADEGIDITWKKPRVNGYVADDGWLLPTPGKPKSKGTSKNMPEFLNNGLDPVTGNVQGPNITAGPVQGTPTLQLSDNAVDNVANSDVDNNLPPLGDVNVPNRPQIPSNAAPLDLKQIIPELYGFAQNKQIPVALQKYTPQLYVPYQMSFQDRLNDNQASFNAQVRQFGNNPALVSQLGAQKYNANNDIRAEEFRTNQGIQAQTINKNVELNNEAQLKNLALADQQYTRQAEARSRTKEINQAILSSVSNKYLQNNLQNKTLKAYENLYDFRSDDNGQFQYEGPDAQFNWQGRQGGGGTGADQDARVIRDGKGNIIRTVTPSQQTIQGQEFLNQERYINALMKRRALYKAYAPRPQ